jgi:mannosyltransferase OCH1-like enzyme
MKLDVISLGAGIPKVIHQTSTYDFMPKEIEDNILFLKRMNPSWEYRIYNEADIQQYISQYFPSLLGVYFSINEKYGVMKADLFKYLLIYNEGGVYLDLKSSFSMPLSDVLLPDDAYLLSHWDWSGQFKNYGNHPEIANPKGEFQQPFIIASKGHPFLKAVIETVVNNIRHYDYLKDGAGKKAVLRITGPIAYTLAITPLLAQYKSRLVHSEKDLGYIFSIYTDRKVHESKFKNHYSTLTEPLIL